MFNDPEIVKLLIYGLGAACAILFLAVLILAFKRNIYYVDENGTEIEKPSRAAKRKAKEARKENIQPVNNVVNEPQEEKKKKKTAVFQTVNSAPTPAPAPVPVAVENTPIKEEVIVPAKEEPQIHQTLEVPVVKKQEFRIKGALVTLTVNGRKEERAIDHLPCLMGRESSSCDFVILEPAVSRRHARVLLYNGELYIEDVSEHNGTYLNGTKLASLSRAPLNVGDVITLGRATIKIEQLLY